MKNAIRLGKGELHWNADGTALSLLRYQKRWGHSVMVQAPIRPRNGFKGRECEYIIYAVPVAARKEGA